MPLPAHQHLIVLCARTQVHPEVRDAICRCLGQALDWPLFLAEVRRVELGSLVGQTLRMVGSGEVPEEITRSLTHEYHKNLARNLLLADELRSVLRCLEKAGVAAVPVKGVFLAKTVYANLGLRQMCDLDVLVRRRDVALALEALAGRGFRSVAPVAARSRGIDSLRDLTLRRDIEAGSFILELHWRFKDRFFRLPEEALWSHLVDQDWEGQEVRVFTPELTLLQLVHHLNCHAFPLKILVDVSETVRACNDDDAARRIDWPEAGRLAKEWGLRRNLCLALEGGRVVLHHPLPTGAELIGEGLGPTRRWLGALVSSPEWYFSRRGAVIRGDDTLRTLFSALFLDDRGPGFLRALLRRRFSDRAPGSGAAEVPRGGSRDLGPTPWLRTLLRLARALPRLLLPKGGTARRR